MYILYCYDLCPEPYRDIDQSACEMTCLLKIDSRILKSCIPYKYVVYTSKTRNKRMSIFEKLHLTCDNTGKPVNRVFNLNSALPEPDGRSSIYHTY